MVQISEDSLFTVLVAPPSAGHLPSCFPKRRVKWKKTLRAIHTSVRVSECATVYCKPQWPTGRPPRCSAGIRLHLPIRSQTCCSPRKSSDPFRTRRWSWRIGPKLCYSILGINRNRVSSMNDLNKRRNNLTISAVTAVCKGYHFDSFDNFILILYYWPIGLFAVDILPNNDLPRFPPSLLSPSYHWILVQSSL